MSIDVQNLAGFNLTHFVGFPLQASGIAGGAAGNHTVTNLVGFPEGEVFLVIAFDFVGATITDLTSEFTHSTGSTINNTGGTDTTGKILLVIFSNHNGA